MYRLFYNNLGKLETIAKQTGESLNIDVETGKFDEENPFMLELREWERENGELDLSDREPDVIPESITYRLNTLLPEDRYTEGDRFPGDIDFNTGLKIGLTTQTIDYFGLRVAQIFYQSLDVNTLGQLATPIPIVFERYEYLWDETTKFPLSRVKKIFFYDTNGDLSEEFKILPKSFYSSSDKSEIVYYRRQGVVNWLIARATELGLGQPVKNYFSTYKDQTDKYILYGDRTILNTVSNSQESWLDLNTGTQMGTVRQSILACFTKALEATPNQEVEIYLRALKVI